MCDSFVAQAGGSRGLSLRLFLGPLLSLLALGAGGYACASGLGRGGGGKQVRG